MGKKTSMPTSSIATSPLHENLIAAGFVPSHSLADRDQLSVKEVRTIYIMRLSRRCSTIAFQVDGRIISSGNKCDYIILINDRATTWTEILTELKGTDVDHAITQLEESLKAAILDNPTITTKKARIVAQSFPSNKSNPNLAKAKRRFLSTYGCELKTVKSGQPDTVL